MVKTEMRAAELIGALVKIISYPDDERTYGIITKIEQIKAEENFKLFAFWASTEDEAFERFWNLNDKLEYIIVPSVEQILFIEPTNLIWPDSSD